ncbi:hypothetical protein C8R44DRAFT_889514 [Mycena epipterygia]|nr:hypothetical protein C8R44DRAFT_889514 [Mycena epipterygia]
MLPEAPAGQIYVLRKREEAFLRLVLHRDYQAKKLDILLKQLSFIHHTRSTKFVTVFDYIQGACAFHVVGVGEYFGEQSPKTRLTTLSVALHHVLLDGGGAHGDVHSPRVLFCNYALRSTNFTLLCGLVRIANALPDGADVSQLERCWPNMFEQVKLLSEMEIAETHG